MISIIVTSYKEPKTIGRAVEALLSQMSEADELLVLAPDQETLDAVPTDNRIQKIQDSGQGKPAALNLALEKLHGEIVVLTDGDVYVESDALKYLLKPFEDSGVGAVSSHPVSDSSRDEKFGYWSHLLTDAIHEMRTTRAKAKAFFECSGYLYAVRRELLKPLPKETLGDDALISMRVHQQDNRVAYAPDAIVHVKYPNNYRDWFRQKVRSVGGYLQPELQEQARMRSFGKESRKVLQVFVYAKNLREMLWSVELVVARSIVWLAALYQVRVQKKRLKDIWLRVESSK